jgi:hypothetical protein
MSVFRELTLCQRKSLGFLMAQLSSGERIKFSELRRRAEAEQITYRSLAKSGKLLRVVVTEERGKLFWELPTELIKF